MILNSAYPAVVGKVVRDENLEVVEIYRNGPRYWVGRGRRGSQDVILKAVIDDTPWADPVSGEAFRPSDQLRLEIMVPEILQHHQGMLAGRIPRILCRSLSGDVWVVREFQPGKNMAAGNSPFIYRQDFYKPAVTEALVDFVVSYQGITPEVRKVLADASRGPQTMLSVKMMAVDLDHPTELLDPYATDVIDFLIERESLHDAHRDTLTHGQVYPPHIYYSGRHASLIDWENVALSNHLQDFVAIWLRGFDQPEWQDWFVNLLSSRGILRTDTDWELWRMESLMQAAGNLNYFFWSNFETASEQAAAIASLRRRIEEILLR